MLICPEAVIPEDIVCSDIFRGMDFDVGSIDELSSFAEKNNMSVGEVIALYICDNYNVLTDKNYVTSKDSDKDYAISKDSDEDYATSKDSDKNYAASKDSGKVCDKLKSIYSYSNLDLKCCRFSYKNKQKQAFESLKSACDAVFADVRYFPVAENISDSDTDYTYSYVDSWFGERNFGGKRRHEGTDIMADINERNIYPVISATKGKVEKIGWLKLGGYRIGIRSENGGYFYYAHLSSYAKDYNVGDIINAGEVIGLMGDSGYGPEGTVGQFDVHLHFGIYVKDSDGKEVSVNPYNVLKSLENNKKQLSFY